VNKQFENIEELVEALKRDRSLDQVQVQSHDLVFVHVAPEQVRHFIMDLRDHYGYSHLVFLTAVDYIENGTFTLTYMLHNYRQHWDIGVQVDIPREKATMESIHDLWAQAATYQRELKEMYGIEFPDSPRLNEPFVLEGWEDLPPMRREFDTKEYSEKTYFARPGRFTKDPTEHMRDKLYPKE